MADKVNFDDDFLGQHLGQLLIRQPTTSSTSSSAGQRRTGSDGSSEASSGLSRRGSLASSSKDKDISSEHGQKENRTRRLSVQLSSPVSSQSQQQQQPPQSGRIMSPGPLSQTDAFLDNLFSPTAQFPPTPSTRTSVSGSSTGQKGGNVGGEATDDKVQWRHQPLFTSPLTPGSLIKQVSANTPLTPPSPAQSFSYFSASAATTPQQSLKNSSSQPSSDAAAESSARQKQSQSTRVKTPMRNSFSTSFGSKRHVSRAMESTRSRESTHASKASSSGRGSGASREDEFAVCRSSSGSSVRSASASSQFSPRANMVPINRKETEGNSESRNSDHGSSRSSGSQSASYGHSTGSSASARLGPNDADESHQRQRHSSPASSVTPGSSYVSSTTFFRKLSDQSSSFDTEASSLVGHGNGGEKSKVDGSDSLSELQVRSQTDGAVDGAKIEEEAEKLGSGFEFDPKLHVVTEEEAWEQWRSGAAIEPPETPRRQAQDQGREQGALEEKAGMSGPGSKKYTSMTSTRSYVRRSVPDFETTLDIEGTSRPIDNNKVRASSSVTSDPKTSMTMTLAAKPPKAQTQATAATGKGKAADDSAASKGKKKLVLVPDGVDGRSFRFVEVDADEADVVESDANLAAQCKTPAAALMA